MLLCGFDMTVGERMYIPGIRILIYNYRGVAKWQKRGSDSEKYGNQQVIRVASRVRILSAEDPAVQRMHVDCGLADA